MAAKIRRFISGLFRSSSSANESADDAASCSVAKMDKSRRSVHSVVVGADGDQARRSASPSPVASLLTGIDSPTCCGCDVVLVAPAGGEAVWSTGVEWLPPASSYKDRVEPFDVADLEPCVVVVSQPDELVRESDSPTSKENVNDDVVVRQTAAADDDGDYSVADDARVSDSMLEQNQKSNVETVNVSVKRVVYSMYGDSYDDAADEESSDEEEEDDADVSVRCKAGGELSVAATFISVALSVPDVPTKKYFDVAANAKTAGFESKLDVCLGEDGGSEWMLQIQKKTTDEAEDEDWNFDAVANNDENAGELSAATPDETGLESPPPSCADPVDVEGDGMSVDLQPLTLFDSSYLDADTSSCCSIRCPDDIAIGLLADHLCAPTLTGGQDGHVNLDLPQLQGGESKEQDGGHDVITNQSASPTIDAQKDPLATDDSEVDIDRSQNDTVLGDTVMSEASRQTGESSRTVIPFPAADVGGMLQHQEQGHGSRLTPRGYRCLPVDDTETASASGPTESVQLHADAQDANDSNAASSPAVPQSADEGPDRTEVEAPDSPPSVEIPRHDDAIRSPSVVDNLSLESVADLQPARGDAKFSVETGPDGPAVEEKDETDGEELRPAPVTRKRLVMYPTDSSSSSEQSDNDDDEFDVVVRPEHSSNINTVISAQQWNGKIGDVAQNDASKTDDEAISVSQWNDEIDAVALPDASKTDDEVISMSRWSDDGDDLLRRLPTSTASRRGATTSSSRQLYRTCFDVPDDEDRSSSRREEIDIKVSIVSLNSQRADRASSLSCHSADSNSVHGVPKKKKESAGFASRLKSLLGMHPKKTDERKMKKSSCCGCWPVRRRTKKSKTTTRI